MRKQFTFFTALIFTAGMLLPCLQANAQAPQKINYQSVIRDSTNQLITNRVIGMKISILQGSATGTAVYVETLTPKTKSNGLLNIEIGGANGFNLINWANGPYFIKTETDPTGGTNYSVTGTSQLLSVPYALHANSADSIKGRTHYIGESYGGGIVFYVYDGGQHGLIAATSDQSYSIQWDNGTLRYTGSSGDGLVAGEMNTTLIVATQIGDTKQGNFAAKVCADYSIFIGSMNYGDWYLPSKYELNLLYLQKSRVGNFTNNYYWSSTESTEGTAWALYFANGLLYYNAKQFAANVRAIRAF